MNPNITIDEVRNMQQPTKGFLCQLQANTYGIQFIYFKMRNIMVNQSQSILFQLRKDQKDIGKPMTQQMRTVKYHFGPNFFFLKTIGTTLEFKVGQNPVKNFLMIQRHYFKKELIKSFQFQFPFFMPNTVNSFQAVYDLPQFTQQRKKQMIQSPWQTKSDSFYFVQGKLIMHNKSEYNYTPFSEEE